ncbi:MAG: SH3 domain-containing protein, partial [Oscillospiraceae bacterium]|nr:SH3 domain-containing protein [Oscillospiraceae bacterium]
IARAIVQGITDYFQIPFIDRENNRIGRVNLSSGSLNVRDAPAPDAKIIGNLQNGDVVLILRTLPEWLYILNNDAAGYVKREYITPLP